MTPEGVEDLLTRYFDALDRGDAAAAAACFTEGACYSHPAYPDEGDAAPRHEVVGRQALERLFRVRGPRSVDRRIEKPLVSGPRAMFEGVIVADGVVTASFVGSATLDLAEGLFVSYAAYVSRPPLWTS